MRYQYDSLVEPISQDGETITLDKWYQPTSNPIIKAVISVALISSLTLVEVVQPVAASTDWIQPTSQPLNIVQTRTPGETVLVEFDVPVPKIDWQPTSQPVFTIPPNIQGDTVLIEFDIPVPKFDWYQVTSQPLFKTPDNVWGENTFVELGIQIPALIEWYAPIVQPVFKTPEILRGESVLVDFSIPVAVPNADWMQPTSQPAPIRLVIVVSNIIIIEPIGVKCTTGFLSLINSSGVGVNSANTDVGAGILSLINSTQGYLSLNNSRGIGVESAITEEGVGLDSESC